MRTDQPGPLTAALRAGRLAPRAAVDRAAFAGVPAATRDGITAIADETLGTPWPQPTLTHWRAYLRDGSRLAWEDPYFARRHRLHATALALALTGDPVTFEAMQARLSTVNLGDPDPPRWEYLYGATHPSTVERMAAARAYARGER